MINEKKRDVYGVYGILKKHTGLNGDYDEKLSGSRN